MNLKKVSLSDKYELLSGQIYLTGTQALVRLSLEQVRREARRVPLRQPTANKSAYCNAAAAAHGFLVPWA